LYLSVDKESSAQSAFGLTMSQGLVSPRFDITFKPKANQMIVFPSNFMYKHSVSPVIEGERYAVVSWLN